MLKVHNRRGTVQGILCPLYMYVDFSFAKRPSSHTTNTPVILYLSSIQVLIHGHDFKIAELALGSHDPRFEFITAKTKQNLADKKKRLTKMLQFYC